MSLTLFGGLEARLDSGGAVALPTRKAQALLAYLAVPLGQAHPREKLAALLWGGISEESARNSLRQALHAMRKALAGTDSPSLTLHGNTVALSGAAVDVDVVAFERAVTDGAPEALEQAAALYRGDLLAGLTVQEPPFEEWLLSERERLRELALEALGRLLAHQQNAGTADAAIHTALRLLAIDSLQEPAHRTLMTLYAQSGRRGSALRQYQFCVSALQRELGIQPEGETRQLYQEILRQRPGRAPGTAGLPAHNVVSVRPEIPLAETPLIGREPDLAQLREIVVAASRGNGRVVVVLGETGIGKTRLLEEVAVDVLRQRGLIILGRCYESEQILPFGPWVDAFRKSRVLNDTRVLEGLNQACRAELARLFPDLEEPAARPLTEASDHLRLFEAFAQLLTHLATSQTVVLVLEDLHWADPMSLRLLSFLGRRLSACRVVTVVTVREEELPSLPDLGHVLTELRQDKHLVELRVAALSRLETIALVRAHTKTPGDESARARLEEQTWRTSEGNPFMIVETLRALEEGAQPRRSGILLPERVREVIVGRLERLTEQSQDFVAVAAVIGREFDFALLQHASGFGEREAAKAVEELVRRRVFRWTGQRFDVMHDWIREAAYTRLLPPRRTLLHASVAHAIEALYAEELEPWYGALAAHYREANVWGKAVEYLTRFAENAARGYAYMEAVAALQEALSSVDRLGADERDSRYPDLILRQANLFHFLGRFRGIVELLDSERLRHAPLTGPCYFMLAQAHSVLGNREEAAHNAKNAMEEAKRSGDDETLGKAHTVLAREAYWTGEPLRGIEHAREAVVLLQGSEDRHWLGIAYWLLGRHYGLMGEFDAALQAEAWAEDIAAAIDDRRLQSHVAWTTGDLQAIRGDWETAIETCKRALELSTDPLNTANALGQLGAAHLEAGDSVQAIPFLERSVEQFSQFRAGQARGWFTIMLGEAYFMDDQLEKARELTFQGLEVLQNSQYRRGIGWAHRTLGRIARARGLFPQAATHFSEALRAFDSVLARFEVARTHLALAELAHVEGNIRVTATHLDEAHDLFTSLRVTKYAEQTDQLARAFGVQVSLARGT